ncbi:Uncharacterised protein [uncultured archaeon]|nr:Uncharacterised protein [uncultured archaeon]
MKNILCVSNDFCAHIASTKVKAMNSEIIEIVTLRLNAGVTARPCKREGENNEQREN